MKTNRLLKNLLILGFILIATTGVYGQMIQSSIIREDVEIWTPLQNPTESATGNDFRMYIPMQFPFLYDGNNVSYIYAYENGFITVNSVRDAGGNSLPAFPNTTNVISWYNRDLFTTGSLSYKFEGTAPYRVLTVQHLGARLLNDFSGNTFDAQIKFYETTNEVKIIYNTVTGFGFSELDGYLYFIGAATNRYINIAPNAPTLPSTFYYGHINPNPQPHLRADVRKYFYRGRSFTLTSTPRLSGVNPPSNAVLASGRVYSGDDRPFVRVSRTASNKDVVVRYSITGPIGQPGSQVIYTAINAPDLTASERVIPNPQPVGSGIRVLMPHAKGPAGRLSDGALDLTNQDNFPSGEYRVDAYLEYLDGTAYSHYQSSTFTIAFPSDIAILDIQEPIFNPGSIYQFSSAGVPIKILVKNQGADPLTFVRAIATIRNANGSVAGTVTDTFNLENDPLLFGEERELTFSQLWKASAVGVYDISVEVQMRTPSSDKFLSNNVFPREGGDKKFFEVAYQIEAEALTMLNPSTVYQNRPVRLAARFRNNGVSDISNTVARFVITYNGIEVYNQFADLKDLPSGLVRTTDLVWEIPFIPTNLGSHQVQITVFADNDEVPLNNTLNLTINVVEGLAGTYSITKDGGQFTTINDAVNALYQRGVAGPVTFLLKDPVYVEGNPSLNRPTIDFSSTIVGLDKPGNTVTFTVDPQFATRGSVQINLYSSTGIGVYFGQSSFPANTFAPVLDVNTALISKYSNAPKNIIFDGGSKKSLVFTIGTNNPFRAVFYLGDGASNIQIKNLLIEDGILQALSTDCHLPLSSFNSFLNRFEFDNDATAAGTYSAGVVLRSRPPRDPAFGSNPFRLDTLANSHNLIYGNEIQKFGYGIVSLGIGQLLDFNKSAYVKYYNHHNMFNNNIIHNVAKAAIFLGYEMNTEVFGNRIYNVQGVCGTYTAGIAAGGEARGNKAGYNNIGLYISSNEISNIRGTQNLFGISLVQARNDYFNLEEAFSFPDEDDNARIINNMIWGFETFSNDANVNAIMLSTERKDGYNWNTMTFEPKFTDYYSVGDVITNNTIILGNDGAVNNGTVIGVSLFNTNNTTFVNNAIEINDPQIAVNNPVTSAVFYYGLHSNIGGFESNRNAYWVESANSAIYRFIETDQMGRVVEFGHKTEFATLSQWQNWTQQDWNSVYGNFSRDFELIGISPFKLRIKSNPYPMGSVLNNRGMKVEGNDVDIDGKLRGEAGEKYDIGAVEFRGRTFGRDGEAVAFLTPGAYKATPPLQFSDAEYVMTTAPVGIKTIIRNNGQLPVAFQNATLRIFRQSPSGTFVQEGATITMPMNDLLFSEDVVVDFLTDDGINNPPTNLEFFPQTYGDLRNQNYNVPEQFKTMEANVTPLYRLEVSLQDDEFNANNKIEKIIRFFIRKSPVQLLVSAENIKTTAINSSDPIDIIAGNLNLDSLKASFFRLGWQINLDLEEPRIDVDIFDRRKWEPRSINYPIYRTLFWVDGHDVDGDGLAKRVTRYDRDQLQGFLSAGTIAHKKNLLVGSQEIVRNETPHFPDFLRNVLSARIGSPENPMNVGGSYDGKYVTGVIIGRDNEFMVRTTDFFGDDVPKVAANRIDNPGMGNTKIGMRYKNHINDIPGGNQVADINRIAVLTTSSVNYNVIFAGIDWRHWANLDGIIRGFFDDLEYNLGNVLPIELLSFDAKAVGKRVDLNWVTASEENASKFVVERSDVSESGKNFISVDEVAAVGNSNITNYYGPVIDTKVEMGKSYIYRLKMLDRDGSFEYSDERLVTLTSINGTISLDEVKPNPARDISTVSFSIGNDMDVTVSLFDINGKEIQVISRGMLNAGVHNFDINLSQIPSGSYTVVLKSGDVLLNSKLNVVK
ncbi:MAG: T9SS type A sorting domain-containing protein [Candidatus Kapabacteria bacterium]|nr:T9SS type A sorting domain-containing protein [Ignavibacteriota bacterium]MCW5884142.1 T9SS type A sorting domain-containing protein [Candidatus Kapabacteria bacterium]